MPSLPNPHYDAAYRKYFECFPTLEDQISEMERMLVETDAQVTNFFSAMYGIAMAEREKGGDKPLTFYQFTAVWYEKFRKRGTTNDT